MVRSIIGAHCPAKAGKNSAHGEPLGAENVAALKKELGLDPEKPGELMYYTGTEKDLSGGGWYHLVGTVLEGFSQPGDYEGFPAGWHELAEGFSVGFKNQCDLLPDDFPRPCCQMEFEHVMPWVLEEPNPYIDE